VGIVLSAISIASDTKGVSEWGIPIWGWYLVGLGIIVASAITIIICLWRENRQIRKSLEQQQLDNINEAKRDDKKSTEEHT